MREPMLATEPVNPSSEDLQSLPDGRRDGGADEGED